MVAGTKNATVGAIKHDIPPEIGSGRWLRDLALAIKQFSDVLNAILLQNQQMIKKSIPGSECEDPRACRNKHAEGKGGHKRTCVCS
jgi:hypothetical protein